MTRSFFSVLGLCCLLALLSIPFSLGASLEHILPSAAQSGESIEVTLQLSDFPIGERVIVSELLPEGAQLGSWSVVGSSEPTSDIALSRDGLSYVWEFTPVVADARIVYTLTLPDSEEAIFDAVFIASPTDFGRSLATLPLSPALLLPPAEVVVEAPGIPSPAAETAVVASALSLPLLALYFTLLGALAYLLLRIRQHAPRSKKHASRGIASLYGSLYAKVHSWLVSLGKMTTHVASETVVTAEKLSGDVHTPQKASHAFSSAASHPPMHSHVQQTATPAPVATPKAPLSENTIHTLDRVSSRYERVLQRIDAYEQLAKDDESVVSLLESLKSELRSISFDVKE